MKKKLLLTILPAFLVLSACSGRALPNNPNGNNGAIEAEDIFEEDTLAHEELFGGEAVSYKLGQPEGLQPRRSFLDRSLDADPVNPLEEPSIGVQYLEYTEKVNNVDTTFYAIRYVAAITSLSVTAEWTRDIAAANGSRPRDGQSIKFSVSNAYTALSGEDPNGEEAPLYPSSVNSKYNYFVVYTLRKIPGNRINSYLFGYLTLTSLDGTESVSSQARIAKVTGGNTWKFNLDSVKGTYFMHGRIKGVNNDTIIMNDTPASGCYATLADSFAANDNFGIFKVGTDGSGNFSHFQFFGYESYRTANGNKTFPFVGRDFVTDFTKLVTPGEYSFNVRNNNTVEVGTSSDVQGNARFYLVPGLWESNGNPRFAVYVWKAGQSNGRWVNGTQVASGVYEFTIDAWSNDGVAQYDRLLFGRMNPSVNYNSFEKGDGKPLWNQTGDLEIADYSNIFSVQRWDGAVADDGGFWTIWFD